MSFDPHKNFARSTVAVAPVPATSGTTMTPTDATAFSNPSVDGAFNVPIWPSSDAIPTAAAAEIVRVTGLSAGVWTIVRQQEGTAARAIVAGDQIADMHTAKKQTDVETAMAVISPATSARNVIQPSAADAVALTLKGHASQTADLLKVTDSANGVHVAVTATGRVGIGASPDAIDTGYTSARLQVYDDGLSTTDEPIVQILAPQARGHLQLHNTDDKYDGFYPWFWSLSEYRTAEHFGQDLLTFWYGMHTPTTEPAFGAFGYGREGATNGVYIGVRSESTSDAEFAFIADLVGPSYPLKVYPVLKNWVFGANLAADALLSAGEFTWGYNDDNTNPTLTIKAKTADGTLASATIPLTPA